MIISIIDDQPAIRYSVSKILKRHNHLTYEFNGQEENIIELIKEVNTDVIILDVMLEFEKTGIDLLQEFRDSNMKTNVILMTAYTTPENVIKATKLDVIDILKKPFEEEELLSLLNQITITDDSDNNLISQLENAEKKFVGSFETMKDIYKKIGLAAKNDLTVLITGETGTGKELVAELIHQNSKKSTNPFLSINCASIPAELFESQLFGHEKGSFTSAEKLHIGYAEQVDEGILFLDEIGELDIQLQSKILRFLENKTFRRVGGNKDIKFTGRIIAATNIDFHEAIKENKFREDLYFRLSMINIELPSLSKRKQDIPLLCEHFINLANSDLSTSVNSISDDAIEILSNHKWDGNIRQLRNTIYNAVLNSKQDKILISDLNYLKFSKYNANGLCSLKDTIKNKIDKEGLENIKNIKEEIDKNILECSIEKCSNITQLSEYLGISRLTLRKRLNEFGIKYKEL